MRPLVVWRFSDGKAGHDNQSGGLTEALARLRPVEIVTPQRLTPIAALLALAGGRLTAWPDLPVPDLLVGAGPGTHLSLLAAQRRARAVVLMRPSLPLALFDLCLIPEHDTPPVRVNVLATRER
ncbi:MAG: ELM1/GtrOC1 family putative glycosyltransferase [Candidatus Competibacteraceae bacterium]